MDFVEKIESALPNSDGWEWFKSARYRLKHAEGEYWYGLRVIDRGEQIEAQPIVAIPRQTFEIIKSHSEITLPFEDALKELETVKKEAELCALSKRSYIPGKKY